MVVMGGGGGGRDVGDGEMMVRRHKPSVVRRINSGD